MEGSALVFVDAIRRILQDLNPQDILSHAAFIHLSLLQVVQIEYAVLTQFEVNRHQNKVVVSFDILMVVTVGITLFWDVIQRGLVCGHTHICLIGTFCYRLRATFAHFSVINETARARTHTHTHIYIYIYTHDLVCILP
jgi:hypothetical protein